MEWLVAVISLWIFDMFSESHFVVTAIFILITVVIFLCRKKLNDDKWRKAEIGVTFS